MKTQIIYTDVLIVGGGTAGCYAAITLGAHAGLSVVVAEKANIERSGCLAAGVNALNAYITEGRTPEDYVEQIIYLLSDSSSMMSGSVLQMTAGYFL